MSQSLVSFFAENKTFGKFIAVYGRDNKPKLLRNVDGSPLMIDKAHDTYAFAKGVAQAHGTDYWIVCFGVYEPVNILPIFGVSYCGGENFALSTADSVICRAIGEYDASSAGLAVGHLPANDRDDSVERVTDAVHAAIVGPRRANSKTADKIRKAVGKTL